MTTLYITNLDLSEPVCNLKTYMMEGKINDGKFTLTIRINEDKPCETILNMAKVIRQEIENVSSNFIEKGDLYAIVKRP